MGRRRGMIGIATAVAALVLAGCSAEEEAAAPAPSMDKVTVGVVPILAVAPIHLGIKQGFFTDVQIDLTLENAQSGATIVPAVVGGDYQFGFADSISLMLARDDNNPIKVVGAGSSSTGEATSDVSAVMVPPGSPITRPADLAGKKVAVNALSNIGTTTISKVVRDDGGDPTTIEFVVSPFGEMAKALTTAQADAAFMLEPFVTGFSAQGGKAVAWPYVGTDPNLMVAAYFTTESLIASDPDLVKRFTAAIAKSSEFAQANPTQTRAILTDYLKIDTTTANQLILPKFPTEINAESFTVLRELAVTDGWMTAKTGPETLLP